MGLTGHIHSQPPASARESSLPVSIPSLPLKGVGAPEACDRHWRYQTQSGAVLRRSTRGHASVPVEPAVRVLPALLRRSPATGHTGIRARAQSACHHHACRSTGAILFHAPGRTVTASLAAAPVTRHRRAGKASSRATHTSLLPGIRSPAQARTARVPLRREIHTLSVTRRDRG